jgi:D-glycero-D-manno-heptose 1,7-bisphosphate phosphatase
LDRDGVINQDRADWVRSWEEFVFLDGTARALARLSKAGASLVVVSNQSLIGRGLASAQAVEEVNRLMAQALREAGAGLAGVFICPHAPGDGCDCRKPKPGLIFQAARTLNLDLNGSWLIGDAERDIQAGQAAGLKTILVRTGKGAETESRALVRPETVVDDLGGAADYLLLQG